MSTTVEYIEFVCCMISNDYAVRYKKMFGEYLFPEWIEFQI